MFDALDLQHLLHLVELILFVLIVGVLKVTSLLLRHISLVLEQLFEIRDSSRVIETHIVSDIQFLLVDILLLLGHLGLDLLVGYLLAPYLDLQNQVLKHLTALCARLVTSPQLSEDLGDI